MEATTDAVGQFQCLTFFMGGEEYAIELLRVKEIIEYSEPTVVPKTPPSIRGVINVRGSVVPVVDLAIKFRLPELTISKRTCIIIVEVALDGENVVMGLVVDAVSEVREFMPDDIERPPAFGTKVQVDYLKGMGKIGEKFALILDIDMVLSEGELDAVTTLHEEEEAVEEVAAAAQTPEAGRRSGGKKVASGQ